MVVFTLSILDNNKIYLDIYLLLKLADQKQCEKVYFLCPTGWKFVKVVIIKVAKHTVGVVI